MEKDEWGLHAVIIKKNIPLPEAVKLSKDFIKDKKKKYYRETKNSYRFRNYPKTYFQPRSFRTKKINNDISLIYGKLLDKWTHLEQIDGGSLKNLIQDFKQSGLKIFTRRLDDFNFKSKKALSDYGDYKIEKIEICRTPVQKFIPKILNFLSLGKLNELMKEHSHDELFHLYALIDVLLPDGNYKTLVFEKNAVVNIDTILPRKTEKTECINLDIGDRNFTINEMVRKTIERIGNNNFFEYDGFGNKNCQNFIKENLISMDLYPDNVNNFVFQNIGEYQLNKPIKRISKIATNISALVSRLKGEGLEEYYIINDINNL